MAAKIEFLTGTDIAALMGNKAMFDGELYQFGITFKFEVFHDPVFVKSNGPGGDRQSSGDLLHAIALSKQLQYFPLPYCQGIDLFFTRKLSG